jgi:hypothetical protein
MVSGPVDAQNRSACAATYDVARARLLVHGGTFDAGVNVQALPSDIVTVLQDGATSWGEISAATPVQMAHNSGGVWHYNPVLDRIVLRGAFTGSLTSRTTTTWDGAFAVVAPTPPISFGPPFFDGLNTRFVEGSSGQVFNGTSWVNVTSPQELPSDANWAYDEDLGHAVGFGGSLGGLSSTQTYTLRGDAFAAFTTATLPPARSSAAMAYDPTSQRVWMAGGRDPFFQPLSDVWAFEGGDWRLLGDLPLGASGTDMQLLYDRARGVMTAFVAGHLFDVRADSFEERAVEVLPRADAMAVFDELAGDLLFVGGLDFEIVVTTMTRIDIAGARAGQLARFDISAAGAAADAAFVDVTIDARAGATGADAAGALHGAELLLWGTSSFLAQAGNAAPATAPAPLQAVVTPSVDAPIRDELIVVLRSPPTGPGVAPARLASEQLEVTLRYQEP